MWQCFVFPDQGVARIIGPKGVVLVYKDCDLATEHCLILQACWAEGKEDDATTEKK